MSVIMVQQITGDPNKLEQFASANQETMQSIMEAAKKHGLIAHRFYGSADGSKVLVLTSGPIVKASKRSPRNRRRRSSPSSRRSGRPRSPSRRFGAS